MKITVAEEKSLYLAHLAAYRGKKEKSLTSRFRDRFSEPRSSEYAS